MSAYAHSLQALQAVQQRAEVAGRNAQQWEESAGRLRAECAQLEASMREQREITEREVSTQRQGV